MGRRLINIVKQWPPVVGWMSLIFLFSTDFFSGSNTSQLLIPFLQSFLPLSGSQLEIVHLVVRKLGHWSEYFVLAVLIARALEGQYPQQRRFNRLAWAIALATLYALGDEWHQSFVPSRSASIVDVMIDSFGAICGTIWLDRRRHDR